MSSRRAGVLVFAVAIAACTVTTTGTGQPSSSSSSSSSSGGTTLGADECRRRCTQKALSCSVPSDQVDGVCARVCDGSYSAQQLSCMETSSCAELEASSSLSTLCPPTAGSSCSDRFDCNGLGDCTCRDGTSLKSASWACVSSACVPDCAFSCQNHGGV